MKKIVSLFVLILICTFSFGHGGGDADFHFTENLGQLNDKARFHCKLHIGDIYFERNKFTFDLYSAEDIEKLYKVRHKRKWREKYGKTPFKIRKHAYAMEFLGANLQTDIIPTEKETFVKNYIKGNDPNKWVSGASSYEKLKYSEIYNNIDLEIYTKDNSLKYDFIVRKGGNTQDIKVAYQNVDGLKLNDGLLEISLSTGVVKELKPIAYQVINGEQKYVDCKFVVNGNELSFNFPKGYDTNYDLIIDPTWIFSSLSGSTADNWGFTATYDDNENFYGGGIAFATGYPTTPGAYDITFGGNVDAVITKFNPTGTALVYSTYIGGSDADQPHSLVTDADSNLVILGVTSSNNFPITAGAYDATFNGGNNITEDGITYGNGTDIFVLKLDNTGAGLIGSTYLGGTANDGFSLNPSLKFNYADHARGEVVLGTANEIYIASSTVSNNFPTTVGAYSQTQFGGYDGVVAKLAPNLTALTWSTYLGGTGGDATFSVRVDNKNNALFVCGGTTSNNLGVTAGVIGPTFSGAVDGYVAKFDNANGALSAMTYVGTNAYDQSYILEIDDDEDIYVVGQTKGAYPVTPSTYNNPNGTQFIHKMDNDLTSSYFSTVFGSGSGSGVDISITAFLIDNCDNIYVGGWGGSTNNEGSTNNMPITGDAIQSTTDGSDFYFIVLDRDAQNLLYGTYFGNNGAAEHVDGGTSRFDKKGTIYEGVCAACGGGSFPTSPGAYSSTNGSSNCNFGAIKIGLDFQGIVASANPPPDEEICGAPYNIDFTGNNPSPPNSYWDFGDGMGTDTTANPTYTYADTGTYNVMYVAIDSSSCNIADTVYFNVNVLQNDSLDAQFTFPPYDPCTDSLTVQLDFTGTGADSLYWNMGNGSTFINDTSVTYTYTTSGTYFVTLEAYDLLCGQTFTLIDTVDFNPSVTTVTAAPPPNVELCSAPYNVNFTGNNPSPPNSYWDFGDGMGTDTVANPMYTYADTGTYNVMYVVIDSSTCNISDTAFFNVTVNQADTLDAQFTFPPYDPCTDSLTVQLDFTGSGADSLYWDMGNGSTFINDTSVTYTYTTSGTYYVTFEAYDLLCNQTFTLIDTVDFNPSVTTVTAAPPPNVELCSAPYNVNFTGNNPTPPNSYWDFGDGMGTDTVANPMYTYADTGTYNVMYVVIDSSTCNISDTAFFNVTVNQADTLDAQFIFPPYDPCTDSLTVQLDFTGSGADSLYWDMGNGSTFINDTSVTYTYTTSGTYYVTFEAYDFICNNSATIIDTVIFTPNTTTVNAVPPPPIVMCSQPYEVNFTGNTPPSPDNYWDFGDGNTSNQANPTHIYQNTGVYNVIYVAIDSSTCNIADTVPFTVTLIQGPTFTATLDFDPPKPCEIDSFDVELKFSGQNADSIYWNMGDGTEFFNIDSVYYLYGNAGTYNVTMSAYNDICNISETISNEVTFVDIADTEGIVPNVFTPNGDGWNDKLVVTGIDIDEVYNIEIFNRWGTKVYEGSDPENPWDGGDSKDGVYFYKLTYTDLCSGEQRLVTGYVTLLK